MPGLTRPGEPARVSARCGARSPWVPASRLSRPPIHRPKAGVQQLQAAPPVPGHCPSGPCFSPAHFLFQRMTLVCCRVGSGWESRGSLALLCAEHPALSSVGPGSKLRRADGRAWGSEQIWPLPRPQWLAHCAGHPVRSLACVPGSPGTFQVRYCAHNPFDSQRALTMAHRFKITTGSKEKGNHGTWFNLIS